MKPIGCIHRNPYRQIFAANKEGRDYVVGDLHGCRQALEYMLSEIGFNYETDRLFSVGDLVDRGPHSKETFDLTKEPWFFCTLGNHEDYLRDSIVSYMLREGWYDIYEIESMLFDNKCSIDVEVAHESFHSMANWNGGMWFTEFLQSNNTNETIFNWCKDALNTINNTPLLISVIDDQNPNKSFNVVHAEILNAGGAEPTTNEMIENPELFSYPDEKTFREKLIWSRDMFVYGRSYAKDHPEKFQAKNMVLTFSGHSPQKKPIQLARQICIDTEAYSAFSQNSERNNKGRLTVFEPGTDQYWSLNCITNKLSHKTLGE